MKIKLKIEHSFKDTLKENNLVEEVSLKFGKVSISSQKHFTL